MWYLRVTYKDVATGYVGTRDLEYDGCTDKKNSKWVDDADKLAKSDKREHEEIINYELINKDFKYILISVFEREIYTQFFFNYEEAQEQMLFELADTYGCDTPEQIEKSFHNRYKRKKDFDYDEGQAWCTTQLENRNWKIEKINN